MKRATRFVHHAFYAFAILKSSGLKFSEVPHYAIYETHFFNEKFSRGPLNTSFVVWLSSALWVKNRLIERDNASSIVVRHTYYLCLANQHAEIRKIK